MKKLILLVLLTACFTNARSQDFGDKLFANPAFMMGTNLGKYLQVLYAQNQIDEMVKFTASETIKKYGREKVWNYYSTCNFGYEIKLKSMNTEGRYKILSYNARINATNTVVRMKTVVENDTAKVVLDNLRITY